VSNSWQHCSGYIDSKPTLQGTTLTSRYIAEFEEKEILTGTYMCERQESPWYPTKGDHSNKCSFRAATRIVTTYMVDVVLQKSTHVTAYFYHCYRVTSNHRQFLDYMPLTSQCLEFFHKWSCEKLTDAIKYSDLPIITLNGMELLHNLQHCSQALM